MDRRLLEKIHSPEDLREIPDSELEELCAEIRDTIIGTVSHNGGHLASNLGTVELTVALHRCFESPRDSLIFDVSHQTYTHKLLTGRYSVFNTLRTEGGISGFSNPSESEHDLFKTGHSSTSISLALGVAEGKRLTGDDSYTVAVIGDGSLSSGLAYEGLNNAGRTKSKLIVIINDNKMSISRNVGGVARHLARIRSTRSYLRLKSGIEGFLIRIPLVGRPLRNITYRVKKFVKNAIYHSNIFEDIGFAYLGPVYGHDLANLCELFESAKLVTGKPVLIHVITTKGKGYKPAESTPALYHSVSPFDTQTGVKPKDSTDFSRVFAEELTALADNDDKICAITAAMGTGTALDIFKARHRERYFDVGIAEEHAVTFAAGIANRGLKPVFAVYSSFLQRAYDELIHDAALNKKPIVIAVDRAGLVGEDGETHHGIFDVAFLSTVPGTTIYSPSDYESLRMDLRAALCSESGVSVIRYPRGTQDNELEGLSINYCGVSVFGPDDADATIITYGRLAAQAVKAAKLLEKDKIYVKIVKPEIIFPLDINGVTRECSGRVFFFEEAVLSGSVSERFRADFAGDVTAVTLPDDFVTHASVTSLLKQYRLDAQSMSDIIRRTLKGE